MLPWSALLYTNICTDRKAAQAQLHRSVHISQVQWNPSFSFTFSGKATVELLFLVTIAWLFWGGNKAYSSLSLLWNLWFHNLATSNRSRYGPALVPPANKQQVPEGAGTGWDTQVLWKKTVSPLQPFISFFFHFLISFISQSHPHFYVAQDLVSPFKYFISHG